MTSENRRILIVDADSQAPFLMDDPLQAEGFDPIFASFAKDGLSVAMSIQPSVILLAADLPDESSLEVCRKLKDLPETQSIPILLLVEGAKLGTYARALDLGAVDFIGKPFHPIELAARVRSAWRSKRLTDMLDRVAQIDELTGMRNRVYIVNRFQEEFERARRYGVSLGVVLLVVDDIKQICDEHGAGFGDIVLMDVAARLRGIIRSSDTHGRCGNSEFLVLLPGQSLDGTAHFADRCCRELTHLKFAHYGADVHATASCGVAAFLNEESLSAAELISHAEKAVATAQASGKNCVFAWNGTEALRYTSTDSDHGDLNHSVRELN